MINKRFDFDLSDSDADGLYAAGTPGAAGAMTLAGALTSGGTFTSADGLGRQICVVSDGDDSGVTFTVVGTDPDGNALTEVITGPNAGTVESAGYFLTVSSVTISGAGTGSITVGTVDEACSNTIPLNRVSDSAATIFADITGTLDYDVQECFDNFQRSANAQSVQWNVITAFDGKTADVLGAATLGATGIRFLVNSFTNGAETQLYVSQP